MLKKNNTKPPKKPKKICSPIKFFPTAENLCCGCVYLAQIITLLQM